MDQTGVEPAMQKNNSGLTIFSSACILIGSTLLLTGKDAELSVVPSVDLKRYQGKWYEIARLPNRFQKKCASDVSATYALKDGGNVEVLNGPARGQEWSRLQAEGDILLALLGRLLDFGSRPGLPASPGWYAQP